MAENDVNLAALWVPVMASTAGLKADLVKAGTEAGAAGAVAIRTAMTESAAFKDIGRLVSRELTSGVPDIQRSYSRLSDGILASFQKINTGTALAIGGVAGFGLAVIKSTDAAGDFQEKLIKLTASADETQAGLKIVHDGILNLAGSVGYSSNELADAMYTVEKANFRGADAMKVLTAGAQLAKIENAELGDVMNVVTTSLNDFHIGADQATTVSAKLRDAVGAAKTNLDDFAGSLHSVEPIASVAKVPLEQVYASVARLTQSGMGAAQGTQNLAATIGNFMNPSQQMTGALGKIGLSAAGLKDDLGNPSVGIVGVLEKVSNAINSKIGPSGKVAVSAFYQNADAVTALKEAYDALSPSSKGWADQLNSGKVQFKDLRQAAVIDPQLKQWMTMRSTVDGLSANLKHLQPDLETVQQLWKEVTGGKETFNVAAQLVGSPEAKKALDDLLTKLQGAVPDPDGNVPGFDKTMEGYKAKLSQFKDAWGAARIELGETFLPVMTSVVDVLKSGVDVLQKHPGILKDVVGGVGLLSTAWLGIKAINLVDSVLNPAANATKALGDEAEKASKKTGLLLGALGKLAKGGLAFMGADMAGDAAQSAAGPSGFWHDLAVLGTDAGKGAVAGGTIASIVPGVGTGVGAVVGGVGAAGVGLYNILTKAAGGQITGSGPKGKDSVPAWLAPGEHVLTAAEVDAMGGQAGVYAFRKSLHRAGGGDIPGFDNGGAAPSVPLIQRSDGTWTSPNPSWAHLIQRESSGSPTVQNNTDSNAQHGDPSQGLFQFTTATWQRLGGGQFAAHPGQATPQQQAVMAARLIQANPSGSDWGAGISGRESASGLLSGLGTAGNPIYTAPTAEHAARADARVKEIQERIGELKPDAKQSTKDRLNDALGFAQQDQARAHDQEAMGGSSSGSGGQGKTQSQAEQFGSGLLSGAMSDLGFGNVLGGKSPLEWPLVKMFTGLASAGLSAGNAWAASKMAGGEGGVGAAGGIPGLNSSGGSGGGESSSGLGGISAGMGDGQGPSDTGLGAGPGGGSKGWFGDLATSPMLSIPKLSAGAGGSNGPGGVPAGPGGGVHTQNDYRLFQAGVIDANGNLIPHGPVTGAVGDVLNGKGRGQFPTGAVGPGDSFVPNLLMPGHDFGPGLLGGPPSSPGTPQKPPTPSGRVGPATGPSMTLVPHFASGGSVDTVPAWLAPGEFVMKTQAVNKYGKNFMSKVNAGKFSTGGSVSLTPSAVSSVPMASSHDGGTSYSGGHHVVNDNRIIVQGNHLSDADQLVGPMQERLNAQVYSRSQFGGLPMAVGPGGG